MTDIETRLKDRAYVSPARARAGINRSQLKKAEKARLLGLVADWEAEGTPEAPIIGGVAPVAAELDNGQPPRARRAPRAPASKKLPEPLTVNLNARIRVKLTFAGVSLLHSSSAKTRVPDDLLDKRGVWETTLLEFMTALGAEMNVDDLPTVGGNIELLSVGA